MKIRLVFFEGIKSDVMHYPETTGPNITITFYHPLTGIREEDTKERHRVKVRECKFEYRGDKEKDTGARIYKLTDIQEI